MMHVFFVDEMTSQQSVSLGEQFTEIFIKKRENVTLLVSLLEVCFMYFNFDFYIRKEQTSSFGQKSNKADKSNFEG
jgi:hypothetical protein